MKKILEFKEEIKQLVIDGEIRLTELTIEKRNKIFFDSYEPETEAREGLGGNGGYTAIQSPSFILDWFEDDGNPAEMRLVLLEDYQLTPEEEQQVFEEILENLAFYEYGEAYNNIHKKFNVQI